MTFKIYDTCQMIRYTDLTTENDLAQFVQSLPRQFFTHKDVMRCYSIFQRNEYERSLRRPIPPPATAQGWPLKCPWSNAELDALKAGVSQFGPG
jgi:hypothetical protein